MELINGKNVRYGQARAYQDSVYEFLVETTPGTDVEAWELCQTLRATKNRADRKSHDGACGFPFGLDSYGSLKQLKDDGTSWRYVVTEPYCD